MSSTVAHQKITRPNAVAVGTIVWLASELMFFAALFAMYFTIRAVQGPAIWAESTELLNIPFAAFNTTILVLSSVTCQFGVFAAERFQNYRTGNVFQFTKWGMREWFATTFLMGAFFVSGQIYEYAMLVSEGKTLSSDAYSSVFYVATGFHGLHVGLVHHEVDGGGRLQTPRGLELVHAIAARTAQPGSDWWAQSRKRHCADSASTSEKPPSLKASSPVGLSSRMPGVSIRQAPAARCSHRTAWPGPSACSIWAR